MTAAPLEVRHTIDRPWLETAAAAEPLTHAYALWDLDRTPHLVQFVSVVRGERTVGYLLVWLGRTDHPIVHWFGTSDIASLLLREMPGPPFEAVVPPEVASTVVAAFPQARAVPLRMMLRPMGDPPPGGAGVRLLGRADCARLEELVRSHRETELAGYVGLDPETEPTWGAFDGERLVGVARAAVRLPRVWVVGGVFVDPSRRNEGIGRGLMAAVVAAAERAGARTGLYVRDEPKPALWLYEGLGFLEVARRTALTVAAPRKA